MNTKKITRSQKFVIKHKIIRKKLSGTKEIPRLSVHKSNKNIIGQIVNDDKACTLVHFFIKGKNKAAWTLLSEKIVLKCNEMNIKKIVFDRSGYRYTGNIKYFADLCRKKELIF